MGLMCCTFAYIWTRPVLAAECGGVNTSVIECEEGGDGGIYHILGLVIDIFSIGVGILAVIGISWAGVLYLTTGGNEGQTTKAKRRLSDIVLGLVCYVLLWAAASWVLPGGRLNPAANDAGVESIKISYSGKTEVGKTFIPKVELSGTNVTDKTYSLVSDNTKIAMTLGNGVKCVAGGSVGISALAANGVKATLPVQCDASTSASSSGNDEDDDATTGPLPKANDGSSTLGSMRDTKVSGNHPHLRKQTRTIIGDRNQDFYAENYTSVINSKKYGSYRKYVKSLGGVFAELVNKERIPVRTAADFQAAAEYVFGLFEIWGQDYNNGTDYTKLWNTNNAFYGHESTWTREHRYYHFANESVNNVLKKGGNSANNLSGINSINTNCDKSIKIFVKSTTLKYKDFPKSGRRIRRIKDLRVGDVLSGPGHLFIVGEVYKNKIVVYDGGSRWQMSGTYKQVIGRSDDNYMGGWYKYQASAWEAYRPWKIDQSVTLKGLAWK